MTYVVDEKCIKCKHMDCVDVCPVDCFYEGENMLVIHPDECIDCGVCEPECPAEAIHSDAEDGMERWININREFAENFLFINNHLSLFSMSIVSDTMAPIGHSGSQTPQSIHSSGCITNIFSPS